MSFQQLCYCNENDRSPKWSHWHLEVFMDIPKYGAFALEETETDIETKTDTNTVASNALVSRCSVNTSTQPHISVSISVSDSTNTPLGPHIMFLNCVPYSFISEVIKGLSLHSGMGTGQNWTQKTGALCSRICDQSLAWEISNIKSRR